MNVRIRSARPSKGRQKSVALLLVISTPVALLAQQPSTLDRPPQSMAGPSSAVETRPQANELDPAVPAGRVRIAQEEGASSQAENQEPAENKDSSPFTVQDVVVTGQRYGATMTTIGRLTQRYVDTPQMVSVLTSDFLKDANINNTLDAMKFVPSVQAGGGFLPPYFIRGVRTDKFYVNGFAAPNNFTNDTIFSERVEIVRGPSSATFGRGDPAGYINYVSKTPRFTRGTELGVTVGPGNGDHNAYRVTLDNEGLVSEDGKTAYRLIGAYDEGTGSKDFSEYKRAGAQLSVVRNLQNGSLTVTGSAAGNKTPGAEGQNTFSDRFMHDFLLRAAGVTIPVPVMGGNYVLGYDGINFDEDSVNATAVLDYKLASHLRTRQAVSFWNATRDGVIAAANPGSAQLESDGSVTVAPLLIKLKRDTRSWSYQGDYLADFQSAFLQSTYTVLFGGDVTFSDLGSGSLVAVPPRRIIPNTRENTRNPLVTFPGNIEQTGVDTKAKDWSVYAQLQAGYWDDRVQLTAAARKLFFDRDATANATGIVTSSNRGAPVMPTYSIVVKPLKTLSVYGTLSKYSEPPNVVLEYGNLLPDDPRNGLTITSQPTTKMREVGIKGSLFDDTVTYSLASFYIKNSGLVRNVVTSDVTSALPIVRSFLSRDRIKGWEFEIFGKFTEHLTFSASGGFLNTSQNVPVTIDPTVTGVIARVPLPDPDKVNAYLKYHFGSHPHDGLSLIAGAQAYLSGWNADGEVFGVYNSYPDTNTLVDLGVTYGFGNGRSQIGLKVNNAFSKEAIPTQVHYSADGRLVFVSYTTKL